MPTRRPSGPRLFAELSIVAAATALAGTAAYALAAARPSEGGVAFDEPAPPGGTAVPDDGATADPDADPTRIVAEAADAMGAVRSVEFRVERSGAPVYVDEFESLALDALVGRFAVPARAQAQLTVTVDGNLTTEIGAVSIDGVIWISNPVTGAFEPVPPGFDVDPSRFFDPEQGWRPLLADLGEVELLGVDDRGGDRYHVRGLAPAARVEELTVGLVRGQNVPVELWIHPGTRLVTRAEFATRTAGAETRWVLELGRYGEQFTIRPPVGAG